MARPKCRRSLCTLRVLYVVNTSAFVLYNALTWIMRGRNNVNVISNRCAHDRAGARDIHLTAFLRDRLSVVLSLTVSLVYNGRGNRFCRHTPVRPLTGRQYDTILIIPGPKRATHVHLACLSRTSVRLTRRGAIYVVRFSIRNKNLKVYA